MKLSDLAYALKLQAQLQYLQAKRGSIASSVSVTIGGTSMVLSDQAESNSKHSSAEIPVSAEKIASIRDTIVAVVDDEIATARAELERIGVEADEKDAGDK